MHTRERLETNGHTVDVSPHGFLDRIRASTGEGIQLLL